MSQEKISYTMLFCALLLVRNAKASLKESMILLPLVGPAKKLAEYIARLHGAA